MVAALTACAPAAVDSADIDQWRVAHDTASSQDRTVLAALSANVPARQGSSTDSQGEIEVDFDVPARVRRIEFSCFGGGSMSASGAAQAGSDAFSAVLGTFDCAQSPHEIDVALFGDGPLDSFNFVAGDSSQDSAWYVTVFG